jgi:SHS2 domain-containing protein
MQTTAEASHAFEEHTGEVRVHLRGATMGALFEEAARALAELMLGEGPHGPLGRAERVEVRARDREALLAAWIDELVFLSETKKRIWVEAKIDTLNDVELVGVVHGVTPAAIRTAVKAATLHDLRVRSLGDGFEATVVLDV